MKPNIEELFTELNRRHFADGIPAIPVVWNRRMTTTGGCCRYRRNSRTGQLSAAQIDLSEKLFSSLDYDMEKVENTLLHEMVHAFMVTNGEGGGHTPRFHQLMSRITGVTKNHRCHSYDVTPLRRVAVHTAQWSCRRCEATGTKARMPKRTIGYRHKSCGGTLAWKRID